MAKFLEKLDGTPEQREAADLYFKSKFVKTEGGTLIIYATSLHEAQQDGMIFLPEAALMTMAKDVLIARIAKSDTDMAPEGSYWLMDPQTPGQPISNQKRPFEPGYYLVKLPYKSWVESALLAEVLP